jgi:predicted exporter
LFRHITRALRAAIQDIFVNVGEHVILVLTGGRSAGAKALPIPRLDLAPPLRWIRSHARLCVTTCVILLLLAAGVVVARGSWLSLETDLSVMHPRPNPALDAQARIARRMGASPDSLIVYLKASSPTELVELSHRVRERLASPAMRDVGISGTYGLATLLPDPALSAERRAAVGPDLAKRVVADFQAVVAQSPFAPEAFGPYTEFLNHLLTRTDPPQIGDLLARPDLAKTTLPGYAVAGRAPATEAMTLVFLDRPMEDANERGAAITAIRAALANLPGATLTGLNVISYDTQAAIQSDLPRVTLLALGIVVLYLIIQLRTLREPLLSMAPTIFSLTLTLAVMHLLGEKLNMVNLVAIPLLIGIDVDYAVFIVNAARLRRKSSPEVFEAQLVSSCHAIAMCAGTTILGFGSLAFTSVPAVRSLGVAVSVGVLTCLLATLFCLLPLVAPLRRTPQSQDVPETEPAQC